MRGTSTFPLGDASAGLGLHHQDFLPKRLSTHEALFFSRYRRDISEAHFRAVVLSVLLLLRLARVLRGPCFFLLVFGPSGARARDPSHKTLLFTVFCCICVSGWLAGCSFSAALSGAPGARATPCQPSGSGPGWGPESWHPRHHLGLGSTSWHRIRFSHKKRHDMV